MDNSTKQLADALRGLAVLCDEASTAGRFADGIGAAFGKIVTALVELNEDEEALQAFHAAQKAHQAGTSEPHTPEPWAYSARRADLSAVFEKAGGTCHLSIAETCNAAHHANARRIVACVNACAGMSTEQLEELDNGQLADIGYYWLRDS